MAKPILKYDVRAWKMAGKTGYYPVRKEVDKVEDEDLAEEVRKEAGFSCTAEEAYRIVCAFLTWCPRLVSRDGRTRSINKQLTWKAKLRGSFDTPDAAWNDKCSARVCASVLSAAKLDIDATFRNVNAGVGVSLDNVTYIGAQGIQNVIKPGVNFAAYGDHMEMLDGDTANLIYGETVIPLVKVSSDVSKAEFEFPMEASAIPADANVVFELRSRGGVEDGQVYVNRKTITMGAYSGNPIIAYFEQAGKARGEFGVDADAIVTIKGAGFTRPNIISAKFGKLEAGGNSFAYAFNPTAITVIDANTVTCKVSAAEDPDQTDEQLAADSAAGLIVLRAFTQMTRSNDLVAHYVA